MSNTQSSNGLEQGLKPRHVTMLSIAGVIGAGLFVGSGVVAVVLIRSGYSPTTAIGRFSPVAT